LKHSPTSIGPAVMVSCTQPSGWVRIETVLTFSFNGRYWFWPTFDDGELAGYVR